MLRIKLFWPTKLSRRNFTIRKILILAILNIWIQIDRAGISRKMAYFSTRTPQVIQIGRNISRNINTSSGFNKIWPKFFDQGSKKSELLRTNMQNQQLEITRYQHKKKKKKKFTWYEHQHPYYLQDSTTHHLGFSPSPQFLIHWEPEARSILQQRVSTFKSRGPQELHHSRTR